MCSNETSSTNSPPQNSLNYPLNLGKMHENVQNALPISPPNLLPIDHYRLQLYNYAMAERLRFAQYPAPMPMYPAPYGPRLALSMSLFHQRMMQPEEPKPQHSYIGLIAMAILGAPDSKLVLSDIYQHILDNYPYFRSRGPGWRNSIRHNLSLNDCFIKAGRSANGKGHYWAVHPANVDDFRKGDFRRRKAQRKVRKHMGLAVDEEGNDSPSPPPISPVPGVPGVNLWMQNQMYAPISTMTQRKRQFDVASLLAPDDVHDKVKAPKVEQQHRFSDVEDNLEQDIDVVTSDQEDKDASSLNELQEREASPPLANDAWGGLNPWTPTFPGLSLGMGVDPRLLGRYYGQLAAQARRVSNASEDVKLPTHDHVVDT